MAFSVSSERHWQRRVNGIAKVPKRKVFTEVGFEPGRECPVAIPSQRSNPLGHRAPLCSLNRMESTNQTRLPAVTRTHCDVFQAGLPWQGMAKLYNLGSIFCHHGDTICHPKSGYVTTKLHGTSTCGCNNNAMFSGRAIFTFPTAVVCWPC